MLLNVNNAFFVHLTVKKLNTPEYRHYLKLWNEETKPKQENTKDLPKLNQVRFRPLSGFTTRYVHKKLTFFLLLFHPGPVYRALQDPVQHVQRGCCRAGALSRHSDRHQSAAGNGRGGKALLLLWQKGTQHGG